MGRRLVLALLLSVWALAAVGCGNTAGPIEQTKPVKELRPRLPHAPGQK